MSKPEDVDPPGHLPSVDKRPGDPARRLEGLSPAKRKLFEMRLRGELPAGAGTLRSGAQPSSPLVDLRPERRPGAGDRPPFFCVHPIGGSVLAYRELASRMGPEQPFYGIQAGIQATGLTGPAGEPATADLPALPAMAAAYADVVEAAVESTASRGPYLLGGWSFGGVVAFEMARQLRDRGRRVGLVALLDSRAPAPTPPEIDLGEAEIVRNFLRDQADLQGLDADWLDERPEAADEAGEGETIERLLARARQTGLLKVRSAQVRPLLDVYRANLHAGAAYRPGPYAGRLILFRTLTSPHPTNGWEALAGEPVEVHELVADHYSLLALPVVAALAKRLGAGIARELDAQA
jgi:thioesterase domain-containing protein